MGVAAMVVAAKAVAVSGEVDWVVEPMAVATKVAAMWAEED